MADPPPYPDGDDDTGGPDLEPPTPRWVKVFGIVAVALILLFVVLQLAGVGGGHGPGRHVGGGHGPTPSFTQLGVQRP
ncbi:MAG: hypothetical protein ACRDNY_09415 [Gaiellaceae bacterium]